MWSGIHSDNEGKGQKQLMKEKTTMLKMNNNVAKNDDDAEEEGQ